jgi:Carboxypeptidase regulatory-like domain
MLLTLAPRQRLTGITIALEPSAVVHGRVLDEQGEPMAGCSVQALPHSGKASNRPVSQSAQTDDRGEYRIYDLPPREYDILGSCMIAAIRASAVADKEGKEHKMLVPTYYPNAINREEALPLKLRGADELSADITIMKTKTVHVRGVVVGNVPRGVVMTAQLMPRGDAPIYTPATVVQNAEFDFRDVVPGSYTVQVSAQDMDPSQARTGHEKIDVRPEGLDGVKVILASAIKIVGVIHSNSGSPIRYSGLFVVLMPGNLESLVNAGNGIDVGIGGMAPVRANGSFEIDGVFPSDYQLLVTSDSDKYANWYTKAVRLEGRDVTDQGLHLASGTQMANVDIQVSPSGGFVEGVVLDEHDQPVADVPVQAIPTEAKRNRFDLYGHSENDQNGHFELAGIAPGDYSIVAGDSLEDEDRFDLEIVNKTAKLGTPVQVSEYGRKNVQLRLKHSNSE